MKTENKGLYIENSLVRKQTIIFKIFIWCSFFLLMVILLYFIYKNQHLDLSNLSHLIIIGILAYVGFDCAYYFWKYPRTYPMIIYTDGVRLPSPRFTGEDAKIHYVKEPILLFRNIRQIKIYDNLNWFDLTDKLHKDVVNGKIKITRMEFITDTGESYLIYDDLEMYPLKKIVTAYMTQTSL